MQKLPTNLPYQKKREDAGLQKNSIVTLPVN